jgi:hypothetical protein
MPYPRRLYKHSDRRYLSDVITVKDSRTGIREEDRAKI